MCCLFLTQAEICFAFCSGPSFLPPPVVLVRMPPLYIPASLCGSLRNASSRWWAHPCCGSMERGRDLLSPYFDSLQGRGARPALCFQSQRSDREARWKGKNGIRRVPGYESGLQPGEGRDTNRYLAGFTINIGIVSMCSRLIFLTDVLSDVFRSCTIWTKAVLSLILCVRYSLHYQSVTINTKDKKKQYGHLK